MVALSMIVPDELTYPVTQVPFTQRHDAIQAFLLINRTKRSSWALQFGAAAGVRTTRTPMVLRTSSIA